MLYPFFAGYHTNITVNSCNTKRRSSLEKSLSEKYGHIPGCQKNGAFHIGIQKNRAIHILFVEKRGPIIYLTALKKWAIRHAHPYYAIYRKLPPETHLLPSEKRSTIKDRNLHPNLLEYTRCQFQRQTILTDFFPESELIRSAFVFIYGLKCES